MVVPQYLDIIINDLVTGNISYSSSWGSSSWKTDIARMFDGREARNGNWGEALGSGSIVMSARTAVSDVQPLVDLHLNTKGRLLPFGFRDPLDSSAVGSVIATADGILPTYQLTKTYSVPNGDPYVRLITKPQTGTVVIRYDAAVQTEGVDYTLDYLTGILTPTPLLGAGVIISSDFDYVVPVRFDSDKLTVSFDDFNQYSLSIGIVEVLE